MSWAEVLRRFWPVAVVVALIAAFFALGLQRYLTLDALHEHDVELRGFVSDHPVLSAAAFIAAYAAVVGISLPGGAVMTMSGGFLFGLWLGTVLSVVGATIGAVTIFVIARRAAGDVLSTWAGPFAARMAEGFEQNAFSYLLFLRLVPLFPFWVVNLAPAVLGVDLWSFITATAIGIVPGALAYASVGDGLGRYFEAEPGVAFSKVFSPEMIAVRVSLALLAFIPIAIRWRRQKRRP